MQTTSPPTAVFQATATAQVADASPPTARPTGSSASPIPAGGRYVVQQGDTLSALARRFGVSIADLANANGLSTDSGVRTGQGLALPGANWSSDLGVRVDQPAAGARIRSPIGVQGTAATFEGAVVIEVLGTDGVKLGQATTQARQPDAGAHGPFQTTVELPPSMVERRVTVRIYWPSPRDGSPRDEVKIPITVVPS